MLRVLLLLLLAANALWWAATHGWLPMSWLPLPDPQAQREPQRLALQVRPEAVTVLPAAASTPGAGSESTAAATAATTAATTVATTPRAAEPAPAPPAAAPAPTPAAKSTSKTSPAPSSTTVCLQATGLGNAKARAAAESVLRTAGIPAARWSAAAGGQTLRVRNLSRSEVDAVRAAAALSAGAPAFSVCR